MTNYLRRAIVAVAAMSCLTAMLVGTAPASSAAAGPQLTFAPGGTAIRGRWGQLVSSGLQAGTSYTVTSDHGTFTGGVHSASFTPVDTNPVLLAFRLPATDPITSFTASLSAAGDPTTLASVTIQVAAPTISLALGLAACPGRATTIVGSGFIEGSYLVQASNGTISGGPVTTSSGSFTATMNLAATANGQFTVAATPTDLSSPTVSQTLNVTTATLALNQANGPWTANLSGNCFAPGEQVTLSSFGSVSLPATATANANGVIAVTAPNRPDALSQSQLVLTAVGQTSQQHAQLNTSTIVRAALWPGDVLSAGPRLAILASHTPGYQLEVLDCVGGVYHVLPGGSQVSWSALPPNNSQAGPCSLTMRTDGNVVLADSGGNPLWVSDTHVAGSHLVLGDDGVLRVLSPTGLTLFNSSIAPSSVSIASSRVHSAVYINGLVHQRAPTAQTERGSNRTVYLQRYLAGHWQNMLSRVTDGNGQLAVGFVQASVYQYRLVLVATSTATGATSGSTFR